MREYFDFREGRPTAETVADKEGVEEEKPAGIEQQRPAVLLNLFLGGEFVRNSERQSQNHDLDHCANNVSSVQ